MRTSVVLALVLIFLAWLAYHPLEVEEYDLSQPVWTRLGHCIEHGFGTMLKPFVIAYARIFHKPHETGVLRIASLKQPARVIRDHLGIPHVYCKSWLDAAVSQGFINAQDRLWQMEMQRRVAHGKVSEALGEDGLYLDRVSRTLGFYRLAEKEYQIAHLLYLQAFEELRNNTLQNLDPILATNYEGFSLVKHFVAGINEYLQSPAFVQPLEFAMFGVGKIPEWTMTDVFAVARVVDWQLSKGFGKDLARFLLIEAVGKEKARELDPLDPDFVAPHFPKGLEMNWNSGIPKSIDPHLEVTFEGGSNAWAISPKKTKSGNPIFATDPHLPLIVPSSWNEMQFIIEPDVDDNLHEKANITCSQFVGVGFLCSGTNGHLAYALTLANPDVDDLYIEKLTRTIDGSVFAEYDDVQYRAEVRQEVIYIKGNGPVVEEVIITRHGPIVSSILGISKGDIALSAKALKIEQTMSLPVSIYGYKKALLAKNLREFNKAAEDMAFPQCVATVVTAEGEIGGITIGRIPLRKKGDGSFIMPGWTSEYDWDSWVPPAEMPRSLNPESGYIVSSNQRLTNSKSYKWLRHLGYAATQGYRSERIKNLIETKDNHTLEDSMQIQYDITSIAAVEFVSRVRSLKLFEYAKTTTQREAITMIMNWDGALKADSVPACLYEVWRNLMIRKHLYEPVLGENLTLRIMGEGFVPGFKPSNEYHGYAMSTLYRMMDANYSWWLEQAGGANELFLNGLKSALEWLELRLGADVDNWRWGNLHHATWLHVKGRSGLLSRVLSIGPYPVNGDEDTPYMTQVFQFDPYKVKGWAPSMRRLIEFGNDTNWLFINTPGQSGHQASKHYSDTAKPWIDYQLFPILRHVERTPQYIDAIMNLEPAKESALRKGASEQLNVCACD